MLFVIAAALNEWVQIGEGVTRPQSHAQPLDIIHMVQL